MILLAAISHCHKYIGRKCLCLCGDTIIDQGRCCKRDTFPAISCLDMNLKQEQKPPAFSGDISVVGKKETNYLRREFAANLNAAAKSGKQTSFSARILTKIGRQKGYILW